jgi:peptidoglycan-associated lipoprotein
MRTKLIVPTTLLGALLVFSTACRKPEAAKTAQPTKTESTAAQTAAQDDAARKKAAEEAARKQAEEEARRKAEQAAAEAARLASYKQAAEKALQDVHFAFDSSDILAKDKPLLQGVTDFLKAYPAAKLQIQGNCDERGTSDYNLSLGERRATAVRDYLAGLGADPARLEVLSYGKEKPVCEEHNEDCWFRNRRAHFILK